MCDYSLKDVASRPAEEGDRLVTHNFDTGTHGFRGAHDTATSTEAAAVCLLPGSEIVFDQPIALHDPARRAASVEGKQTWVGVLPQGEQRVATFMQVNQEHSQAHHDALQFADGSIVMLTQLAEGQEARVLSLPATPRTHEEAAKQRRAEYA